MDSSGKSEFLKQLREQLPQLAEKVHLYHIFPARPEADILIWSTLVADQNQVAGDFFGRFVRISNSWRLLLKPVDTLWGFTRSSIYYPGKSEQEIDPLSDQRKLHLVIYPFIKTADWYLMSKETRQGMMNEHIRIGKKYPQITQLLLYSTGLQDQEFVVAYETEDLVLFSELVSTLRSTEARKYTLRDTPIYTAIWRPLPEILDCWR
jgi:chlorite dismutase